MSKRLPPRREPSAQATRRKRKVSLRAEDREVRTDDQKADDAIVDAARRDVRTAREAWADMRKIHKTELEFVWASKQWPEGFDEARTSDGRVCLTINRLPQFLRQVSNQIRQNRPAIEYVPIGSGSDVDTAEALEGLVRHTEVISTAATVYDTAVNLQLTIGIGAIHLTHDWVDDTFEQEIYLKEVTDMGAVFLDPATQAFDWADARYGGFVEDYPKDEYEDKWGDISPYSSLEGWAEVGGSDVPDWLPEGRVRVLLYYRVEEESEERVVAMVSGPAPSPDDPDAGAPEPPQKQELWMSAVDTLRASRFTVEIKRRRTVRKKVVHWYRMNACDILERGTCPGKRVPIFPVVGERVVIDGKVDYIGMTRNAMDPARMYNVWVSAQTEVIALAPRAPMIVPMDQIRGFEDIWRNANVRNYAFLPYHAKAVDGNLLPPPQRNQYEPPVMAIAAAVHQADNDLKSVMGIFDASLGQPGPENSGKAIIARQRQGDIANLNWSDNLGRAEISIGRALLDWYPVIYDTPRMRRILDPDGTGQTVIFHAGQPDQAKTLQDEQRALGNSIEKIFDLNVGRFDVSVQTGPSYDSRRAEAADFMQKIVQAYPNLVPVIGDLMFDSMDFPSHRLVARRLQKMLPPQLQDAPNGADVPPQITAQLSQLQAQAQQWQQEAQRLNQIITTKQLELASKENIAAMTQGALVAIAAAKLEGEAGIVALKAEYDRISTMFEHTSNLISTALMPQGGPPMPGAPAGVPGPGAPPAPASSATPGGAPAEPGPTPAPGPVAPPTLVPPKSDVS